MFSESSVCDAYVAAIICSSAFVQSSSQARILNVFNVLFAILLSLYIHIALPREETLF